MFVNTLHLGGGNVQFDRSATSRSYRSVLHHSSNQKFWSEKYKWKYCLFIFKCNKFYQKQQHLSLCATKVRNKKKGCNKKITCALADLQSTVCARH